MKLLFLVGIAAFLFCSAISFTVQPRPVAPLSHRRLPTWRLANGRTLTSLQLSRDDKSATKDYFIRKAIFAGKLFGFRGVSLCLGRELTITPFCRHGAISADTS